MNVGCGDDYKEEFINVDLYKAAKVDLVADIRALPYSDGLVDEIYASHVLEHFGKWEMHTLLTEWCRALKPQGKMTIIVPDLEWVVRNWLNEPEENRWGWPLDTIFGHQSEPGETHKTGFTMPQLQNFLQKFPLQINLCEYRQTHGQQSIYVEATKL